MARTNNRVTGVVIRDDKVLLIHRFKFGDEYWVFPGGGVKEGETLEDGLRREMFEETNLKLLSFTEIYRATGIHQENIIFYNCVLEPGEPQLGGPEKDENSDQNRFILEWIPYTDIFNINNIYPKPEKQYFDKCYE